MWVRSLYIAVSCMLLGQGLSYAKQTDNETIQPYLSQRQISDSTLVEQVLIAGVDDAHGVVAQQFYLEGEQLKQKALKDNNWGPVVKVFASSVLYNPRPLALNAYADSQLNMFASIIKSRGMENEKKYATLVSMISFYRVTQAADNIVHELSQSEKELLDKTVKCSEAFLEKQIKQNDCRPLVQLELLDK